MEKILKFVNKRRQNLDTCEQDYLKIIKKDPACDLNNMSNHQQWRVLCRAIESKNFDNLLALEKIDFNFHLQSDKLGTDYFFNEVSTRDNWKDYFNFFISHGLMPIRAFKNDENLTDMPYSIYEHLISNNAYEKIDFLLNLNIPPVIRKYSNILTHKIAILDYTNLKKLHERNISCGEQEMFGFVVMDIQDKTPNKQKDLKNMNNIISMFVKNNIIDSSNSYFVAMALLNHPNVPHSYAKNFILKQKPDFSLTNEHELHVFSKMFSFYNNITLNNNSVFNLLVGNGFNEEKMNASLFVYSSLRNNTFSLFDNDLQKFKHRIKTNDLYDLCLSSLNYNPEDDKITRCMTAFFDRLCDDDYTYNHMKKLFEEALKNNSLDNYFSAYMSASSEPDLRIKMYEKLMVEKFGHFWQEKRPEYMASLTHLSKKILTEALSKETLLSNKKNHRL